MPDKRLERTRAAYERSMPRMSKDDFRIMAHSIDHYFGEMEKARITIGEPITIRLKSNLEHHE